MSFLSPVDARKLADRSKFGNPLPLFTSQRTGSLLELLESGSLDSRAQAKWNSILLVSNGYTPLGPIDPWDIPSHYSEPEENDAVMAIVESDGKAAVDLALRWRLLGDPADADAVADILSAWVTLSGFNNNGESRLPWCNHWPMFIEAAQLIDGSDAYTPSLKTGMENVTEWGLQYTTAYIQTANRAVWGCMYNVTAGAFLGDRSVFDKAIHRWRELFDHDVAGNIPIEEITRGRNGLFYCNFLLNAMTQTAEIARFNGEWLYDYKTPDGSTYKGLWETVASWTAHPETYPYWPGSGTPRIQAHVDPLHALWPNDDSQLLIDTYTTTQDYYGYRQGILAYRYRPLWD